LPSIKHSAVVVELTELSRLWKRQINHKRKLLRKTFTTGMGFLHHATGEPECQWQKFHFGIKFFNSVLVSSNFIREGPSPGTENSERNSLFSVLRGRKMRFPDRNFRP